MEAEATVREVMTREYVGVSESDPVDDAVDLMLEEGAAAVVVLRGADPVGTLTPEDALSLVGSAGESSSAEVAGVMSGTVPSVPPDVALVEAAGRMADADVGSVLVTEGEEVVGVVSERDVVGAMATIADHAALSDPTEPAAGDPVATDRVAAAPASAAETTEGGAMPTESETSTQSVCEICGSLTPDLHSFNGQMICGDCREI